MAETKFKYKNQSSTAQTLIGYGRVEAGEVIETNEPVHNPNFVIVDNRRLVGVEGPVEQPKPNDVITGDDKPKKNK